MTADLSKLAFLSAQNYMKREERPVRFQDVILGAYAEQAIVIEHNLGFIPEYDIWAELDNNNGVIWSGNIPEVGMSGFYTPAYAQTMEWVDNDDLTITVKNNIGSTITVRVYYLIYKDYA